MTGEFEQQTTGSAPLGIFGGTFDPIHLGHLRAALELQQAAALHEVRFVPCRQSPLREAPLAPAKLRLEMIRSAVRSQPAFVVDERELWRDGPSYSVTTLESLRADFPDRPLALMLGMDAFLELEAWHRWQEILDLAHIVVARRPGAELRGPGPVTELLAAAGVDTAEALTDSRAGRIFVVAITQLDISASNIRELVWRGSDPSFLLPDAVRDIIARTGCYAAQQIEEIRTGAE